MRTLRNVFTIAHRAMSGNPAVRSLRRWRQIQRTRRELAELDDRMLRDIGLTREEALRGVIDPSRRRSGDGSLEHPSMPR